MEQSASIQGYLFCFYILRLRKHNGPSSFLGCELVQWKVVMKIGVANDRPRSGCAAITARSQGPSRRCCCLGCRHKSWRSCLNTPGQNSPSPARRAVGVIAPASSTLPDQTSAHTGPRHAIRCQQLSPGTATRFHSCRMQRSAPRNVLSAPRSARHESSASCLQLGL